MWALYGLLSAVFGGGRSVYDKHLLNNESISPYIIGALTFAITVIVTAPIALYLGEHNALKNTDFLWATAINVVFNVSAILLYFKVLKKHDASLMAGIQSIEPLFVVLTAFLFIGETITLIGGIGIVIIVMGSFLLQTSRSQECKQTSFWQSPWILMFIYMSLSSSATAFSKIAVTEGGVFIYIALRYIVIVSVLLLLYRLNKSAQDKQYGRYQFKISHIWSGIFITASVIFEMLALDIAKAAYVEAIRRTTIFFALLFENIFLKNSWNQKRFLACIALFTGAAIIVILG